MLTSLALPSNKRPPLQRPRSRAEEAERKHILPSEAKDGEPSGLFPPSSLALSLLFSWIFAFVGVFVTLSAASHCSVLKIRVGNLERAFYDLSRDGIGLADLASRYNGGHVLLALTTPSLAHDAEKYVTPFSVLEAANTLHPGQCWLIHGSSGQFGIGFRRPVAISHISIDHIAKELSFNMANAPKEVLVWGILGKQSPTGTQNLSKIPTSIDFMGRTRDRPLIEDHRSTFVPIAAVNYDINGSNFIQTFPVFSGLNSISFDGVVVEILGNWGGDTTCLYRIRVHGRRFPS
ncbi:hypothetical protein NLJ89_g11386 [Agrocybe chaxingu]|uniref:SUN domain-containing protein n=1 Tax=Agrocybe chaxingu TaxID=84603 RepID=A0A9W8JPA9_9AGAR|nr:hypothetical protein NLJ89_g11386 [Agrocybe chaxingu]